MTLNPSIWIPYTFKPIMSATKNINRDFLTQQTCNAYWKLNMSIRRKKGCGDKNKVKGKWFQNFVHVFKTCIIKYCTFLSLYNNSSIYRHIIFKPSKSSSSFSRFDISGVAILTTVLSCNLLQFPKCLWDDKVKHLFFSLNQHLVAGVGSNVSKLWPTSESLTK